MINIGDSAKEKIDQLIDAEEVSQESFIRVSVTSGGCSGLTYNMQFDNTPQENDQVFEDKGIKIVTDLKSYLYLFNSTLEFSGGLQGKGFYFVNPNASRECACGESFAV